MLLTIDVRTLSKIVSVVFSRSYGIMWDSKYISSLCSLLSERVLLLFNCLYNDLFSGSAFVVRIAYFSNRNELTISGSKRLLKILSEKFKMSDGLKLRFVVMLRGGFNIGFSVDACLFSAFA